MDNQIRLTRLFRTMIFRIGALLLLIVTISGCKRNPEATHRMYLENNTEDSLVFQVTRKHISEIPGWERTLPPNTKTLLGYGALHLSGDDITFQTIRENFGLPTDTVEILRADTLVIRWGGPLRVMPDSVNHFYNESSWDIRIGGIDDKWEIGTFTIYKEDIGSIETPEVAR